jgi:hypothetical protein
LWVFLFAPVLLWLLQFGIGEVPHHQSFEAINKLVGNVASLENELAEAKHQVANAVKAKVATNNADDDKKLNDSLNKRTGKLESK